MVHDFFQNFQPDPYENAAVTAIYQRFSRKTPEPKETAHTHNTYCSITADKSFYLMLYTPPFLVFFDTTMRWYNVLNHWYFKRELKQQRFKVSPNTKVKRIQPWRSGTPILCGPPHPIQRFGEILGKICFVSKKCAARIAKLPWSFEVSIAKKTSDVENLEVKGMNSLCVVGIQYVFFFNSI